MKEQKSENQPVAGKKSQVMDLNYLKKLLKIFDSSSAEEIEIEDGGLRIKVTRASLRSIASVPQPGVIYTESQLPEAKTVEKQTTSESQSKEADLPKSDNLYEVKSPMVGTLYRAPSPDADPYVNVGSSVTSGTVLCIIEAMKLMNEIESEVSGKIVKVLVENGQPVEYNQPLFLIEKS